MSEGKDKKEEHILIVKLSPLNGLNSSMLRTLALIKGLVENGYNVELLTIRESDTTVLANIEKYSFIDKIDVVYTGKNTAYDKVISSSGSAKKVIINILRKIYHKFSLYDYTQGIANKVNVCDLNRDSYDYVISVSDPKPAHIAMRRLINQGLKYGKWIQYWGDPFATDITVESVYPRFVYKIAERNLFSNCDSIIYTSPFTVKEQKILYPRYSTKMKYVPTAYIEEKIFPDHSGEYMIGYYGAYNSTVRNILPLYHACSEIKDVKLTVVGNSDISLEEKNNISIFPRGEIDNFEKKTDLFVCVLNLSGTQIPGKVYHYAATNKPVLIVLDGEHKDELKAFFQQFKRYELCENSKEEIVKAIHRIRETQIKLEPCALFSSKVVSQTILE